jgi:diguanylate cyclase (GGDEF)-like protein
MNRSHEFEMLSPDVPIDLNNCDLEPIHIPSTIQPHGLLIAARSSDLRIVYISENSTEMLGGAPALLLQRTLPEVLGKEAVASIETALGQDQYVPTNILTLSFRISGQARFDVTAHRTNGLLCVEIEPANGERRWDQLSLNLGQAIRELRVPRALDALCTALAPLVRSITGYDRVMVYRFDRDGHGEVIAEAKDSDMEPFLGLHYPATDIPRQARKLFLLQRVRAIVDVGYVPVRVFGNAELVESEPIDMTYCGLRSVSPIHIEYLQNMGVGASLSISLIHRGELWGMVLCHHRTKRLPPPELRAFCDQLGQLASLLIGKALQAQEFSERLGKRALLDVLNGRIDGKISIPSFLAQNSKVVLSLVGADGALIHIDKHTELIGVTPDRGDALTLMATMHSRLEEGLLFSDNVGMLLPGFAHLASTASGICMIEFNGSSEAIVWFRGEVAKTVQWGGDPDSAKEVSEGSIRMSPRKSFSLWEEIQRGRSLPWLSSEIEAARGLQRIIIKALLTNAENKLRVHDYSNPVTGLPNRRALVERLSEWWNSGSDAAASMLFLDLDQFNSVNLRLGYEGGDEFLRQIGDRLRSMVGVDHCAAHVSGDEFAIFCMNTDIREAIQLATLILRRISDPVSVRGKTITTTTSIGIAPVIKQEGAEVTDPLRAADSAMYVAKHKGGNQFSIVESRQQAEILRLAIVKNIADRELAAEKLATAYAHVNSVLESTTDGVITVSPEWIILYGNQKAVERLPGFEVGSNYWNCFPGVINTPLAQTLRVAMEGRSTARYEVYYAPFQQWFEGQIFPTDDGLTIFFRNNTEEKKLANQLEIEQMLREKRIEALSHMAGGLAHEISNPLAIIHARASDLRTLAAGDGTLSAVDVRKATDSIVQTSDRAMKILRGLKGFAREAAQDPMELASIYEIAEQCLEMQQTRLEHHHIQLRLDLGPDTPRFLCRETQIGQIVTNLLNNAADAITQSDSVERWIEVKTIYSEGQIVMDIIDSGPGIEDHFKSHLMEPFFTTKELGLGMGVGLSLSRAIAQDHGGTLTLCNDTEHTCFRLVLPVKSIVENHTVEHLQSEVAN